MKVTHVITGLSTGGAERALFNLLSGGLQGQCDNRVVSLTDTGTYAAAIGRLGVPVVTLDMRRGLPSWGVVKRLRNEVLAHPPDFIQGWMYHGNLAAWLMSILAAGKPVLAWNVRQCLYGLDSEKAMTRQVIRASRFLSGKPDAIVYNSELSRKQHESFGFRGQRSRVIPNGFDVTRSGTARERRFSVRDTLGVPRDALVVGHIARFHPMKDHRAFVCAAIRVAEQHPDVHFVLAGYGVTPGNDELTSLVPSIMARRFHFLGERNDVPDLMSSMDVFCQSSWSEAFPNVLGEAMSAAVPCVATDVGDSAAIIGDTGLVVPPRDESALAAGLSDILTMTAGERRSMGEVARERVKDKYSLPVMVEQYTGLYEKLALTRGLN
jgi:glycosyltransferase involved in cell wall biosynthesis